MTEKEAKEKAEKAAMLVIEAKVLTLLIGAEQQLGKTSLIMISNLENIIKESSEIAFQLLSYHREKLNAEPYSGQREQRLEQLRLQEQELTQHHEDILRDLRHRRDKVLMSLD